MSVKIEGNITLMGKSLISGDRPSSGSGYIYNEVGTIIFETQEDLGAISHWDGYSSTEGEERGEMIKNPFGDLLLPSLFLHIDSVDFQLSNLLLVSTEPNIPLDFVDAFNIGNKILMTRYVSFYNPEHEISGGDGFNTSYEWSFNGAGVLEDQFVNPMNIRAMKFVRDLSDREVEIIFSQLNGIESEVIIPDGDLFLS